MNFYVFVEDNDFDNANSTYGEIKLHKYTNMKNDTHFNSSDAFEDIIIPLGECIPKADD